MARLRSAPVVQVPSPKAQSKRQALREKTNTTRSQAPVYENDGDTEGLIKDAKVRRGRPKKGKQHDGEVVMTGGLGLVEDAPLSETALMTTDELAKSDAPLPPTAKANRRPPRMARKPVQNEAQSKVLEGLKKRMEETARKEAGGKKGVLPAKRASRGGDLSSDPLPTKAVTARPSTGPPAPEPSEYDIELSPPPPGKLTSVKNKRSSLVQPTSVLRPQSTPAVDNSILKNFRRRPRQPSMLAMVQQRTASARPSAANAPADPDPSVFDFDAEDSAEEDDFAPDAEGTPLHVSKAKRKSAGNASKKPASKPAAAAKAIVQVPKKRKSDDIDLSSGSVGALRAKRQKSHVPAPMDEEDPLVGFTQAKATSRTSSGQRLTPQPHDTSDVQVINSSQSTPPPAEPEPEPGLELEFPDYQRDAIDDDFVVPSTEDKYEDAPVLADEEHLPDDPLYDVPNGTMAEPVSSSPVPIAPTATQQRIAEELADPVTQLSPQRQTKQKPKRDKAKPMSTATLQSLLPKRRQPLKQRHRKSEYDFISASEDEDDAVLDASHLEDDEDELGGRIRRPAKTTQSRKGRKSVAPAKAKARQSKAPQQTRKSSAAPQPSRKSTAAAQHPSKKPPRTYGRATTTASDKENGADDGFETLNDEDDTAELPAVKGSQPVATKSKELEEARRKFAEVDEWDMEFESLGDEEHRSSSQQWR